ncbi:MAG: YncE family protein [Desulfuromonadales bacterium]|nr:YncE family protein [Desulfuromonadales bacterium]
MKNCSLRPILPGLLAALLALALLTGCQAGMPASAAWPRPLPRGLEHGARLSVFLTLKEAETPAVRLHISALEVLAKDTWLPVAPGPLALDSAEIGAGQVLLGGRGLPPGRYHRLRFTLDEAKVRRSDGRNETVSADSRQVELELPASLLLEEDDSRSLFLTWDVQGSLEGEDGLRPAITVAPQLRPLLVDLIYVTCPDIDTIFVVRSDKNWVADSFGVKGQPTWLAVDPDPSRRRLYVLAAGEATIKVVDLHSQRVVDLFPIPLADFPTFMTLSPDGRWGYVLEEHGSYLSRIDLATGRSTARVRLRYRPLYATYLAEENLLAVSAGLTQTVLLLNPVDLKEVGAIRTGNVPRGLLPFGNLLYIAESGDHTVTIFDRAANRVLRRLDVGFGPRRLLSNGEQIFVSNYDGGSISVLLPGQLGVVREIRGLGRPREMVHERVYRRLYVADEQAAALAAIDSTTNQLLGFIALGAPPLGLAVVQ